MLEINEISMKYCPVIREKVTHCEKRTVSGKVLCVLHVCRYVELWLQVDALEWWRWLTEKCFYLLLLLI